MTTEAPSIHGPFLNLLNPDALQIFSCASEIATAMGDRKVGVNHLLAALSEHEPWKKIFEAWGIVFPHPAIPTEQADAADTIPLSRDLEEMIRMAASRAASNKAGSLHLMLVFIGRLQRQIIEADHRAHYLERISL